MELADIRSKEMPHSIEAEQAILAAIIKDKNSINEVREQGITADSFYISKHRDLYSVMDRLDTMSHHIDVITVINEAVTGKVFENSETAREYLVTLVKGLPTVSSLKSYCQIVREKSELRYLISAASEIADECIESADEVDVLIDSAEQKIYNIRSKKNFRGFVEAGELAYNEFIHLQELAEDDKKLKQNVRTGYGDLDRIINGLNKSDLLILAARPGMGKTSFALNIATNVARNHPEKAVAVFSLEMSGEQLITRGMSSESRVDLGKMLRGDGITDDDWSNLINSASMLGNVNMYIDDTAGTTINQMKAKLRRIKEEIALVVIDYLQLMNSAKKTDNRVNEISEITRSLKLMAKELNVPIITLSQLSRAVESRPDKHPLLSDLRESGSIEQDADIVMFLYRDGYYNPDKCEDVNRAECIVAKNRHGETGSVNMRWNGQYTLFVSESNRQGP